MSMFYMARFAEFHVIHKKQKMNNLKKAIVFWGILDLCSLSWYIGSRLYKGGVPFYGDIAIAKNTALSFGHPIPFILTSIGIVIYVSFLPSGILLMKQNKYGAIISYIQTPFRIGFALPSIFFILWPWKYIIDTETISKPISAIFVFALILLSETIKLYTVIKWQKK